MFGKHIVMLRKEKGMTQTELAKSIGIGRSALALYETEKREPDIDTLIKLADFFSVSVGYILGTEHLVEQSLNETTIKKKENSSFFDDLLKDTFTSRLKKIINNKELSEDILADLLHMKKEKLQSYANGDCEPSLEDLISISKVLEVSIDYLLGQISVQGDKLLHSFQRLTEDNQDIIIGKAKELLKEQRYDEFVATDEPLRKTGTDSLAK